MNTQELCERVKRSEQSILSMTLLGVIEAPLGVTWLEVKNRLIWVIDHPEDDKGLAYVRHNVCSCCGKSLTYDHKVVSNSFCWDCYQMFKKERPVDV